MILKLIWHNLWRNTRRTLITISSIAFAVLLAVCMKSLQKGIFDELIKNVVGFYTGYIQVHHTGYQEEQTLENCFDYEASLQQNIESLPHITATVARLESFALASSGNTTKGCLVIGTQADRENSFSNLSSKIIAGAYFTPESRNVMLSEGLAKKLGLTVHDTLVILGQGYQGNQAAGKYGVGAIIHFGSPMLNESLLFLTLPAARELFSAPGKITTIACQVNKPAFLQEAVSQIRSVTAKETEVITWKEMMPDIDSHIRADNIDFYIFIGVLYLMIAFGILGTILMMLAERRYELGMLLAIGMQKRLLALMLTGETILISILGTLAGMLLSFPVVKYFEFHPIRFSGKMAEAYVRFGFEPVWPATFDIGIFLTQGLIVLVLALLIGLFPLIHVSRMNAIQSMKR